MADIDIMRVVEVAFSTRQHGDFNCHTIITKNDDGERDQITLYTNDAKELIRSVNGKRIIDEVA